MSDFARLYDYALELEAANPPSGDLLKSRPNFLPLTEQMKKDAAAAAAKAEKEAQEPAPAATTSARR
jgi:hypothetical protein